MISIATRVKVSHQAGYGHWVRQCHLARALIREGCRVTLYPDSEGAIETIAVKGCAIVPVTGHDDFVKQLSPAVDLAILDFNDTSAELIGHLRPKARWIAGFEDLGPGRGLLDLLIDCNLGPENAKDLPGTVRTLFGYPHSLLAEEYESVGRQPRQFRSGIRRILVTMGGSDPNNLTPQVIAPILEYNPSLQLTVVVGPGFKPGTVPETWSDLENIEVISSPKSLGELLLIHDAVICSGGVTLHEALVAGTPAFVVPQVEHQEDLALKLEEHDATWLIGTPGYVDVNFLLEALETPSFTLNAMSRAGRSLIDGCGLGRITQALLHLVRQ